MVERDELDRQEIIKAADLLSIDKRKNLSPEEVYSAISHRINAEQRNFNPRIDPDLTKFIDQETHYELERRGNFNYESLSRLTEQSYGEVRVAVIRGLVTRALEIFQGKHSPEDPTPDFGTLCTTSNGMNLRCDLRGYIPREE